jgi:hypothetical protein
VGLYHLHRATVVVPLRSVEGSWDLILMRLERRDGYFWSWRHSGSQIAEKLGWYDQGTVCSTSSFGYQVSRISAMSDEFGFVDV